MAQNLSSGVKRSSVQAGVLTALLMVAVQSAAAPPTGDASILPAGATVEELWNDGEFTEGVAVAADGGVYFSDIPLGAAPGRILKFDPQTGRTSVDCPDSGKSNGLMFDRDGRLFAACGANGGRRALCEITPDGDVRTLVDQFQGRAFNSPNDVVIHPDGSIYFTDPRYVGDEPQELDHMSVYRYLPATGQISRATTDIAKPNGVVCAPGGETLYVALTDNGADNVDAPPTRPVQMKLLACPRRADGSLGPGRVLIDFGEELGIDGMTVDQQGHIYAALRNPRRPGIAIYTPQGEEIAHIPTDELPTNCCFGRGKESRMLYITAGGGLYRIPLKIPGYHPAVATAR